MSSPRSHSPLGEGQLTPKQQEQVNEASTSLNVSIKIDDDIAVTLLQAAKQNVNIEQLEIRAGDDMCSNVVHAVADLLVTTPTIQSITFDPSSGYTGCVVNDDDHYVVLAKAIAESDNLQTIMLQSDLPKKLEQAVVEALKHKKTLTKLFLRCSKVITRNPSNFSEMLATGNIYSLQLLSSQCDDWIIHDGLKRCQSLVYLYINLDGTFRGYEMGSTFRCLMKGLHCNQSLRHLDLRSCFALESSDILLLNEFISKHETLSCLTISDRICDEPEDFDALCDAVSRSRSIKELNFDNFFSTSSDPCDVYAVSRMLQQSTCLECFSFPNIPEEKEMEELAVGIIACKTLNTLFVDNYFSVKILIETVIASPSITKVNWEETEFLNKKALREVDFFALFNAKGRSLVRSNAPDGLWPFVLAKAGRTWHQDALYYYLQEIPQLVMHHSASANPKIND